MNAMLKSFTRHWLLWLLVFDGLWIAIELSPSLQAALAPPARAVLSALDVPQWSPWNWMIAFLVLFGLIVVVRVAGPLMEIFEEEGDARKKERGQHRPSKKKKRASDSDRIDERTKAALDRQRLRRSGRNK